MRERLEFAAYFAHRDHGVGLPVRRGLLRWRCPMIRLQTWLPPRPLEEDLQRPLVELLDRLARVPWTHVPLGEHRACSTGAKLKAMGTKRGWLDFQFLLPPYGRFACLEIKRRGGKPSDVKRDVHDTSGPSAASSRW